MCSNYPSLDFIYFMSVGRYSFNVYYLMPFRAFRNPVFHFLKKTKKLLLNIFFIGENKNCTSPDTEE